MARFRFEVAKVKRLIDHALASKEHNPTNSQAYEVLGDDWLDGKVKSDVLRDRIPAALHLVKDDGIYIMSNGHPEFPGAEFEQRMLNGVVYANGHAPPERQDPNWDEWWDDKVRRVAGRGDFVERVDISSLQPMPPTASFLEVCLTANGMSFGWVWMMERARSIAPEPGVAHKLVTLSDTELLATLKLLYPSMSNLVTGVAKSVGLSTSLVLRVLLGQRRNADVDKALVAAFRKALINRMQAVKAP